MTQIRTVDVSVAPENGLSYAARAESLYTVAGSGSVSAVAGVGHRLSVGATSGDEVLVQTPERLEGPEWLSVSVTALLAGTQAGRRADFGFIEDANVGAYVRVDDGVVRLIVDSGSAQASSVVSKTIALERVHTWTVKITNRRSVEFFVDGESLGAYQATTAVLTNLIAMRAAVRLSNPSAAVGSANVDVHAWSIDASSYPVPRRVMNTMKANVLLAKDEPGMLAAISVSAVPGAARYLMLFDSDEEPVDTDVPVARLFLASGAVVERQGFREELAMRFAKGIAVALSTSHDALTLPVSAEAFFEAAIW